MHTYTIYIELFASCTYFHSLELAKCMYYYLSVRMGPSDHFYMKSFKRMLKA
uniref:Uncharacterized protein n=1 Tax=Manihot esculenta TaxID=3983 RepID=A0A2C9V0A1_MANES